MPHLSAVGISGLQAGEDVNSAAELSAGRARISVVGWVVRDADFFGTHDARCATRKTLARQGFPGKQAIVQFADWMRGKPRWARAKPVNGRGAGCARISLAWE